MLTAPGGEAARRTLSLSLAATVCTNYTELHTLVHTLLLKLRALRASCPLVWTVRGFLLPGGLPKNMPDADIPALPPGVDGAALQAQAAAVVERLEPVVVDTIGRMQALVLRAPELANTTTAGEHQELGNMQQVLSNARLTLLRACHTPLQARYILWVAAHNLLLCVQNLCHLLRSIASGGPGVSKRLLQSLDDAEAMAVAKAMLWPSWEGVKEEAGTLLKVAEARPTDGPATLLAPRSITLRGDSTVATLFGAMLRQALEEESGSGEASAEDDSAKADKPKEEAPEAKEEEAEEAKPKTVAEEAPPRHKRSRRN